MFVTACSAVSVRRLGRSLSSRQQGEALIGGEQSMYGRDTHTRNMTREEKLREGERRLGTEGGGKK